ncbi:MAG: hypothetical protein ACLP9Y_15770 [Mycobacterium sp.]
MAWLEPLLRLRTMTMHHLGNNLIELRGERMTAFGEHPPRRDRTDPVYRRRT